MDLEVFPFVVGWEFTLACNLRCRHCGSSAGIARPNELTTDEALQLCDQFPALLVQEVDFTGGEPLLRKDWPVVAARLKQSGIQTNILTNGLETDRETIAVMKEVGISAVGMSLDGLAGTHDYIRRRAGSYEAVLKSIDLFQNHQVPLNIITTVNASNIDELEPLFHVLKERGVEYWRLQPIIATGRVKDHTDLQATAEVILAIGRFVQEHQRIGNGDGPAVICADGLEYITDVPGQRPWRGCSAGIAACGIRSDGKVTGCLSMPEEIVEGDLRKDDLWNIWFREDAFPYSRHFDEGKLGPNCTGCEKGGECMGGCSSNSYAATGSFHNDPYCFRKISQVNRGTSI